MSRLTAIVIGLLLLSCAAGPLGPDSKLGAGEGVILLRVASNMEFPEWQTVSVRRESDGETVSLNRIEGAVRGSTFFAASIPGGRYTLHQMYATYTSGNSETGGFTYSVTAPLAERLGDFSVAAGQLTNLGTLVHDPGKSIDETHSEFSVAVDPRPLKAKSLLMSGYPRLAEAVGGKPELGWQTLPAQEVEARVIATAKQYARGLNSLRPTDAGVVYAGARMGQVLVLPKPGAPWLRFDTGGLDEITAVQPLPDGGFLAGGEQSFVAYSADRGRTWQTLGFVEPNHVVTLIGVAATRELVLVAESSRDVIVYTSPKPATGWHELRRFGPFPEPSILWGDSHPEIKFNLGGTWRRESVALSGGRLAVLEQPKTVWSYDFAARRWDRSAPAPDPLFGVRTSRDGYLWATPIMSNNMYGSSDWGATWKKLEYFKVDLPPAFASRSTGYMAAMPWVGLGKWELYKTTDGGASWSSSGKMADSGVERLVVDPSGKRLYAVTATHKLWVSSDGGNTWAGPH